MNTYTSNSTLCCHWCKIPLGNATQVTYLNGNLPVCDLCLSKAVTPKFLESITIIITETDAAGLSVSCKIPEELKNKISGALAERTMEFITTTMNKLTGEDKTISRREIN